MIIPPRAVTRAGNSTRGRVILSTTVLVVAGLTLSAALRSPPYGRARWLPLIPSFIEIVLGILAIAGKGWARNALVDVLALTAIFGVFPSAMALVEGAGAALPPLLFCVATGGVARFLHVSADVASIYPLVERTPTSARRPADPAAARHSP